MLVEFTFENFKCYKDETALSMVPAQVSEHAETLVAAMNGRELLPVSVIYGPNGGGKSSVLQAFDCMQSIVTWPYYLMRREVKKLPEIACEPYAFDEASNKEPSTFCVVFETGEHIYQYIISVLGGRVIEEYLHRRKPGKGATATLFERSDGAIVLGPSLRRKKVSTEIDAMMPYLSYLAINHDFEPIEEAFGWLRSCHVLDYSVPYLEEYVIEPPDEREKRRIIGMLNGMGIDVTDIRYEHDDEGKLDSVFLTHGAGMGRDLELEEESSGTKKLMNLVPAVIMALERGNLVVSDELDAKLHPKLLKYLIRLFTDRRTNPKGAQLVFTSHDMSTLNSAVFRRDEIRFAAKTEEGPSTLWALSDIVDIDGKRIRPQNAYDRQYLEGRYGADPYLMSMLDWDDSDEQ